MKSAFYPIYTILVLFVFLSCSQKAELQDADSDMALVNVNGKTLYKNEISEVIPKGLNSTDSTMAAEAYIKMWIKNELIYEKAVENIADKDNIDELVENYRQSLTIFTYQERLIKERLSKSVTDKEMKDYYDANPDKFDLESDLIKGLFLKVPQTAPQLDDLRKWSKQGNEKAIESIEKYSLQNAVIYDYFYDKWVNLDDVLISIPHNLNGNTKQFLINNKSMEVQDSTYVYLLNIKEYVLAGNKMPFEYAKGHLLDIIVNQKRVTFLKTFEDELYKRALDKKQIKYYNK